MVNYAVTDVIISPGTLTGVMAAMETAVEAVDNTKTIRLLNVFYNVNTGQYEGAFLHDA